MNLETFLFLPLASALAMLLMTGRGARNFAVLISAAQVACALWLCGGGVGPGQVQSFQEWLPMFGINLSLAIDGANIWLITLTPIITALALLTTAKTTEKLHLYSANLMLLNGLLVGLFLAQNLGLFYIFFEAMLLPTVVLVAGWSRIDGRQTALRFFMYTLIGSLPMLLAILFLAFQGSTAAGPSLEFSALGGLPEQSQLFLFLPFVLAFLIKMPIAPLHGWLPPLYRNAPASVTAVIAAMMSKAGAYGLLKVGFTVFPLAFVNYLPYLGTLAILTILYGAVSALGSESLREVLAFSSLSHMGMIALGLVTRTPNGVAGASLQMAAHVLATGGLFLVVALMERRGLPDELRRYGGLARSAPRLAALSLFLVLAGLGQPGLSSFPGELLILTGVYTAFPGIALLACLSIILAAAYMLRWYQTVFTGEVGTYLPAHDLLGREMAILLVPISLSLLMGLAPSIFLRPIQLWLMGVL